LHFIRVQSVFHPWLTKTIEILGNRPVFKFITVPIQSSDAAEAELNSFLQSHRVLSIDRRWVDQGSQSFWVMCIDYHTGGGTRPLATDAKSGRSKVDYREVLSKDDFARYAQLRDLRKAVAQADAVPVYTIFTNEQLATMVRDRCLTGADLEKIAGVGDGRATKYGPRFLELLSKLNAGSDAPSQ